MDKEQSTTPTQEKNQANIHFQSKKIYFMEDQGLENRAYFSGGGETGETRETVGM